MTNTFKDITDFTGLDLLKIDIANTYGLDKAVYSERLEWATDYLTNPVDITNASEPLLFKKAVLAYQSAIHTGSTNHNVFMDATASGLQILACLSNCKSTGIASNLVFTNKRQDPYTLVTDKMLEYLPNSTMFEGMTNSEVRAMMKKPIMVYFYNGTKSVEDLFGKESQELEVFYEVLEELFPGAIAAKEIINTKWSATSLDHTWTLPDSHVAHVKVIDKVHTRIEVDELECQNSFKYTTYFNQPSKLGTSLAPNIIHSIDAYIVREVIRRCDFQVAHIHDAFTCHPNNMSVVMDTYRTILSEIANSNLLADILSEITHTPVELAKFNYDLASDILKSQYSLC